MIHSNEELEEWAQAVLAEQSPNSAFEARLCVGRESSGTTYFVWLLLTTGQDRTKVLEDARAMVKPEFVIDVAIERRSIWDKIHSEKVNGCPDWAFKYLKGKDDERPLH